MGMHFQSDHLAIISPDIGQSPDRGLEPVAVDEITANQDMLAGDEGAKHVRNLGIGKTFDRKFVEHGYVGCCRDMIADSTVIAGEFRIGSGERDRHERRRAGTMRCPAALDTVAVRFQFDIGRLNGVATYGIEKLLKKFMLGKPDLRIFLRVSISEIGGRLHIPQCRYQQRVVILGHREQYIDADRLGVGCVDRLERLCQDCPIDRRPLSRQFQRIFIIDDHDDIFVFFDFRSEYRRAQVIERSLGFLDQRRRPAESGDEQGKDQKQ